MKYVRNSTKPTTNKIDHNKTMLCFLVNVFFIRYLSTKHAIANNSIIEVVVTEFGILQQKIEKPINIK